MMLVRQNFPQPPPLDIRATLHAEFEKVHPRIKAGARIAVAVGSRGITNLPEIVAEILDLLRAAGAQPFIIPAMGSHGGATPDGQREVLASYGITESAMGVPIRPSLEVRQIGTSADGVPVFCSLEALGADGVVLVNRIKPHTDFLGELGSGLMKMSVIGLGKHTGAMVMHGAAATRLGHERAIRGMARVLLRDTSILCGVAILENQFHDTARLVVLTSEEIESREDALFIESRKLMPQLPFNEIDLLIVDRLGKNISGAGMDPNVIARSIHGYSSSLMRENRPSPFIRRIFVRDLTPQTHGNAVGIGLADVTTTRLVHAMDPRATYINALTALTPQCAKIPIHFDTDREAIERVLASLAITDSHAARIVRIADTLSLIEFEVSEALREEVERDPNLTTLSELGLMQFDAMGKLAAPLTSTCQKNV
jgi:hypothetical protein